MKMIRDDVSMAIGFAIGAVVMFAWAFWMDHRKG